MDAQHTHAIALIIDDEVADILIVDARLAAILLSDPTLVDVSPVGEIIPDVKPGYLYDPTTGTFTDPAHRPGV